MYKTPKYNKTRIVVNEAIEGLPLERSIEKIMNNEEK